MVTRAHDLLAVCLAVGLLLCAMPMQVAQAQDCRAEPLEQSVQQARKLTTLLKIANFRADVKYMGEVAGELTQFLDGCGDVDTGRLALVCDYDCHLQLGRYSLFMASELPYLSSASGVSRNDTPLSPQRAQQLAEDGLRVIERGLSLLGRQQKSTADPDADEGASYREFVRQLTLLNALKIRLYMSTGDTWYQTVSEARVKQLDFLITDTLSAGAGAGVSGDPNLAKAITYYETAMWGLIETKMDIPGETTYDDLRADLLVLENELKERLDSVNRGFLFLNIDPLAFTSINFEELKRKIDITKSELFGVERSVESIVERWHQNRHGEATREIDEQRIVRSQQVNLIAHRIGKMEREAREFTLSVQQQINDVDADRDTWNFRQQIRNLEMELATKMAEYENRRRHVNQKREFDLILLSKEAELDRRNELRWLLSWEMSRMNLDLQISSIQSQIVEYERQKSRNDNRLAQLVQELEQKQESLEIALLNIEAAENAIAATTVRQTDTYWKHRAVIRESLCRIETELAFVGGSPDNPFVPADGESACEVEPPAFTAVAYNTAMCGSDNQSGLRQKLIQEQIRARAFILECIVGDADFADLDPIVEGDPFNITSNGAGPALPDTVEVNCGSFSQTETDFAKALWDKEKEYYDKKKQDLEAKRDHVLEQISYIKTWVKGFQITVASLQAGLAAAEIVLAALAAVPETTVHAAGLASGISTKIKISEPARTTVMAIRQAINTAIELAQIEIETEVKIKQLEQQLLDVEQFYENIDLDKGLKSLALHQTHFQLAGRRASGENEIEELLLQNQLADVDCQSAERGVQERIATLKAEHARQLASLELTANENELLEFEIQAQEKAIARTRHEIRIIEADIERLRLTEDQLVEDNQSIVDLIDAARARIDRVAAVSDTVTTLADASLESTNAIRELRERQQQAMLALSDSELQFVEARIATEQSNTAEMIDSLEHAMALGLKSRELQGEILEFQQQVQSQTIAEQEELMKLVSQIDDPQAKRNLFIANEEMLADLLKGIPEYIDVKRRLLQTANRTLHLMRRRYSTVAGITGSTQGWPSTYVRNGTQLDQMVADIANDKFFNERQINVDVSEIVIPANSGFARTLALNEKVDFEISPDAAGAEGMQASGFLSLWDDAKFGRNRNLTLLDVLMGVQYTCSGTHRNKYLLRHKGDGMVFHNIAEGSEEVVPQLVIGPGRSFVRPFYNLASSLDTVERILDYWEDAFTVRSFPPSNGPPNDTRSVLPFLGAPVIGTYEVFLRPSTCGFDGAVFTLYLIFSSSV